MNVRTASAVLFRMTETEPAARSCESLGCGLSEVITVSVVVTSVASAGLAALLGAAYIHKASEKCQEERRRVFDEHEAFKRFADRVEAIETASSKPANANSDGLFMNHHHTLESTDTIDSSLRRVVSIYEDTVMSVPHYGREYDETVFESLSAELGPDTATSLAVNNTLSQSTQRALVSRSREAASARVSLADAIGMELDALTDVESKLSAIDRRRRRLVVHLNEVNVDKTGAALDIWHQLNDLEHETENVATERQQSLRNPPMQVDTGVDDTGEMEFYDYLYGAKNAPRHPVLAQIADLTEKIHNNRDYVASVIADGN